jgi:hypothetical protein
MYRQSALKLLQLEQVGVCPSHFCFRFLHRWQARATRGRLGDRVALFSEPLLCLPLLSDGEPTEI